MFHPLTAKLGRLRSQTRRRALCYGLSVTFLVLLGAIVSMGLLDYLFRFEDRGLRIMASAFVVAAWLWAFYRYVLSMFWMPLSDAALARRVECCFPSLGDRLQSAVELLHARKDDPAAGSDGLRQAFIEQTTIEAEPLDFLAVLTWRPLVVAGLAGLIVCLASGLLLLLPASRIAAARLVRPLGDVAWPRVNHLTLREPIDRVAWGRAFQVDVIDAEGAPLPSEVRIHYRFTGPDGAVVEETEPAQYVEGTMTARRERVVRPFAYRVEGGDDQTMPWQDVSVVEPPRVDSLSIRLTPPAYTGWPSASSERHIRALVGTKVRIDGLASEPLQSASVNIEDGTKTAAQLADDGLRFAAEFTVEKSGSYWIELTNRDGFSGGADDRWELLAIPDTPPKVHIDRPKANVSVASNAVVTVRVTAKDDLAVREIRLVFQRVDKDAPASGKGAGGDGGEVVLWRAKSPQPSPRPKADGSFEGDTRTVDYRWDLGALKLKLGMQIQFHAIGVDCLPQTGKSDLRTIAIISDEELRDRIAAREKLLHAELERALRVERACREQVESAAARLATPPVEQAGVDQLQTVSQNQREADQLLTSRGEGLPMHLIALLTDLEDNRIDADDLARRLRAMMAELDRLGREQLPLVARELTAAIKTAQVSMEGQGGATAAAGIVESLSNAGKHQDAVIASLGEMLGQLSRLGGYRQFAREIGQMIRQQEDVTRRTAEVGRRTLTQDVRDLSDQDESELKTEAGRQRDLARLLDRVLQEMDQAGGQLSKHDPSAAKNVAAALEHARRLGVNGQMRTAGQQIERNQIGQAAAGQKQIAGGLHEVLDLLAARQGKEPDSSKSGRQGSEEQQASGSKNEQKQATSGSQTPGQTSTSTMPGVPQAVEGQQPQAVRNEEVQAAMKQLWGELPEHVRQQMLELPVEQFPPKYEQQIEAYFRRLAEQKGEGK